MHITCNIKLKSSTFHHNLIRKQLLEHQLCLVHKLILVADRQDLYKLKKDVIKTHNGNVTVKSIYK